jgi:hypothetical protein
VISAKFAARRLDWIGRAMSKLACIVYGFAIWAGASVAFRLLGQFFFRLDIGWVLPVLAVLAIPAIGALTLLGFRLLRVAPELRVTAAAIFVATGMPFDALATLGWSAAYPNLPATGAGAFAAYMLWCNTIALVTGIVAAGKAGIALRIPAAPRPLAGAGRR